MKTEKCTLGFSGIMKAHILRKVLCLLAISSSPFAGVVAQTTLTDPLINITSIVRHTSADPVGKSSIIANKADGFHYGSIAGRSERSLILFDIHNQVPTPTYLLENKAFLETQPFDGICVYLADADLITKLSVDVMTNNPISYSSFYTILQPLQGQQFSNLKNNFVFVFGNRPADLFDDWSVAIQNFANLAKAIKDVGLKGIFFDNEAYPPDTKSWGANYPEDVAYSSTYSLQEYRDQARLRGKQMMQAMTSEFPDIEVITAHGPYLSEPSAPGPLFPGWQTANELIEPLFVGFMEGLNGTAKNIDGGELYTLRSASDFQKTYEWRKTTIASNSVNSGSIPAEDRLVWTQNANISYGIYDVTFGGAPMNPSIMQTTVTNALNRCDQYVWFFSEQISFLLPGSSGGASSEWVNAVSAGRLAAQNMDCSGFKATPYISNERCIGCNDGSISLNVSGGTTPYTFSWSDGSTSKNISGVPSGIYSVTIKDLNECTTTSTVNIKTTYRVMETTTAPAIDGDISEFVDADSIVFSMASGAKANVKALWNSNALYVAAKITDHQINALIAERDGAVADEDAFELFIDKGNNEGSTMDANDYQFSLNVLNTQCDRGEGNGLTWNGVWQSAVIIDGTNNDNSDIDNGYSLELAIPWSTMGYSSPPSEGKIVGIDFAVDDKQASGIYSIQWPNNTSTYQNPANWQKGVLSGTSINTGLAQLSERENINIIYTGRNNRVIIDLYSFCNRNAELEIYSATGNVIAKKILTLSKGYQQESFALPSYIGSGVYIIRLSGNDGKGIVKKIVVTN